MKLEYLIENLQYFSSLDEIGPDAKIESITFKDGIVQIYWDNGGISSIYKQVKISPHWITE